MQFFHPLSSFSRFINIVAVFCITVCYDLHAMEQCYFCYFQLENSDLYLLILCHYVAKAYFNENLFCIFFMLTFAYLSFSLIYSGLNTLLQRFFSL